MNLIISSKVKAYCHESQKQISKEAIEALNSRVVSILDSAIRITGRFSRITECEINSAK